MTQPIFALRGESLDAYYAPNGEKANLIHKINAAPSTLRATGLVGVFGASVIDVSNPTYTGYRGISYSGNGNVALTNLGAFSVIMRIVPMFTGHPPQNMALWSFGSTAASPCAAQALIWLSTGAIQFNGTLANGNLATVSVSTALVSGVSGTALEIQASWDGVQAHGMNISIDGVFLENLPTGSNFQFAQELIESIILGTSSSIFQNNFYIDEFLIFNVALPTSYTARTAYYPSLIMQPLVSTDPGAAEVDSNISYNFQGNIIQGTLLVPPASDVRFGVGTYNTTGTLVVPPPADVKSGVATDATVGSLIVPSAADVRFGTAVDGTTGTAYIPAPVDVRLGTAVDHTIGLLTIGNYNAGFMGTEPSGPEVCLVWGYLKDITGTPVVGAKVKFSLTTAKKNEYMEASNHMLTPSDVTDTSDVNGYFAQQLVRNSEFEGLDTSYTVSITAGAGTVTKNNVGQNISIVVPAATDKNITLLLTA